MSTVDLELFREPADADAEHESKPDARVIAVSGAKGGAGKSLLSANLAVYLATIGRRVVLLDADQTGANVHGFLGAPHPIALPPFSPPRPRFYEDGTARADPAEPPVALSTASTSEAEEPSLLTDVGIPGLKLFHAGRDEPPRGHAEVLGTLGLMSQARSLDADFVVLDLGTGLHDELIDLWLEADLRLFLTLPEPTSVEGTYRFVRTAFFRAFERKLEMEGRIGDLTLIPRDGPAPFPSDLIESFGRHELGAELRDAAEQFDFPFVVNQARVRSDLSLGSAMVSAARRRLGVQLSYEGYIDYDDSVWNALRVARPLLVESPGAKASRSIEKIARMLIAKDAGTVQKPLLSNAPSHTHHDILEVDRGATDEEVRRASKRARDVYGPESLAVSGLFDAQGLEKMRTRVEEAQDVLLDPARRRPYELSVFPPTAAKKSTERRRRPESVRPPPPAITPESDFTGALLRSVRESQGIELKEVSEQTRIQEKFLLAIEEDRHADLPAMVYVRGFVGEIAKVLGLDPVHVTRSYLRNFRGGA